MPTDRNHPSSNLSQNKASTLIGSGKEKGASGSIVSSTKNKSSNNVVLNSGFPNEGVAVRLKG